MKILRFAFSSLFLLFCFSPSYAHTINYHLEQKGISIRVFFPPDNPASYSRYEIFGPSDSLPHQTGRTDKNGFLSFVPDRVGLWKVKVQGESQHGFHGVKIDVKVDKAFNLESFSKPIVAAHTKLITGVSLIFGIFGVFSLLRARIGRRSYSH